MNLVLTIAVGPEYQRMSELTHPSIKAYAKKIGAEFLCISKQEISKTTPHWDKFQISTLLEKYDRILYLDTDIVIRDDCPNLFDIVPENCLSAFNEAPFTDRSQELLIDCCKQYNITLPQWNGKYYNTGVMVISQMHKRLFEKPEKEHFSFYEQSYLNMMIAYLGFRMYELDYKFNRMTCMDRPTGEERFASWIIHYAGYPSLDFVIGIIKQDLQRWKRDEGNYKYQRHLCIQVNGGLGDQICAGPALKYLIGMYPDDEIVIATHWPRILKHLSAENVQVSEYNKVLLEFDVPYWIRNSLPGPETIQWAIVSHILCHTVDYCSMALLKRTLPMTERTIEFKLDLQDYADLFDMAGTNDLKDFVAIHPGRHWNTKTFPSEYWQEIIDDCCDKGPLLM